MMIKQQSRRKRRGAAIVEFAIVCILLFMALFGIFEYCRMLFIMHLANNAARDAARFAVVHTSGGTMPGEPTTISKQDIINIVKTGKLGSVYVGSGLCGMDQNIENLNVEVFLCDPAMLAQNPPVVQELSGSQWNTGSFQQKIAIRITGQYRPVLPTLLFMNSTLDVRITVLSGSEAN